MSQELFFEGSTNLTKATPSTNWRPSRFPWSLIKSVSNNTSNTPVVITKLESPKESSASSLLVDLVLAKIPELDTNAANKKGIFCRMQRQLFYRWTSWLNAFQQPQSFPREEREWDLRKQLPFSDDLQFLRLILINSRSFISYQQIRYFIWVINSVDGGYLPNKLCIYFRVQWGTSTNAHVSPQLPPVLPFWYPSIHS